MKKTILAAFLPAIVFVIFIISCASVQKADDLSQILDDPPQISDETRVKIADLIAEADYLAYRFERYLDPNYRPPTRGRAAKPPYGERVERPEWVAEGPPSAGDIDRAIALYREALRLDPSGRHPRDTSANQAAQRGAQQATDGAIQSFLEQAESRRQHWLTVVLPERLAAAQREAAKHEAEADRLEAARQMALQDAAEALQDAERLEAARQIALAAGQYAEANRLATARDQALQRAAEAQQEADRLATARDQALQRAAAARQEVERLEAVREQALQQALQEAAEAQQEADRLAIARDQALQRAAEAQQEADRLAIARDQALQRAAEAQQEADRLEAARQQALAAGQYAEAERLATARQQALLRAAAARQEAERLEAARQQALQRAAEARQEAEYLEAARQQALRRAAAARQEAERLLAAREQAQQEAERLTAAREQARQEAERLLAARQQAAAARQKTEAERLEAARQMALQQAAEAQREVDATRLAQAQERARQQAADAERRARGPRENDFAVRENPDNTLTITGIYGPRQIWPTVVIPGTIRGLRVTHIGAEAFAGNGIVDLVIPDTVIAIGNRAFSYCLISNVGNPLENVTFGAGLEIIGNYAFAEQTRRSPLSRVVIPDSVTRIGRGAFINNSLEEVVFGENLQTIGEAAFDNNHLTSIILPANVRSIESQAFARNPVTSVAILSPAEGFSMGNAFTSRNIFTVTLPANMSEAILTRNFAPGLVNFYARQGRVEGTYVWNGRIWSLQQQ
ncbi:MAG: leucine-rich repeat protein [Spirochaetes bacterium]|nr:leucine-rich repeat protein [Spirochaetota bacterium]